jgi:hypothetical protein
MGLAMPQVERSDMRVAATNAASSDVKLDRKTIKRLGRRSDVPGNVPRYQ